MANENFANSPAIWFHRPTALNQVIFSVPILGYLTGAQAVIIFAVGVPLMFLVLEISDDIKLAAAPVISCVILAMIRPQFMPYESRIYAAMQFLLSKKEIAPCSESEILRMPKKRKSRAVQPAESAVRITATEKPIEISLTLADGSGRRYSGKTVRIMLDGIPIKTAVSSSSGQASVLLEPEECRGTRSIAAYLVDEEGAAKDKILQRRLIFSGGGQ